VLLLTAFIGLIIVEAALLEGFLPYRWRHAIHLPSEPAISSQRYAPHPDMDSEFEVYFQQHSRQLKIEYVVFGILSLANTYLIARVWRAFKTSKSPL
jgi:hypothetical protein